MHGIWKTWLSLTWWAALLFGVALALAAFPQTDAPMQAMMTLLGADAHDLSVLREPVTQFCVALMGAVTIGWMLAVRVVIDLAETSGARAWRGLMVSVCGWYVIDGALSAATGFARNIVPNTLFLLGFVVPVLGSGVLRDAR